MKEIGWWLALGLANLAAILDCGHFVIGGGLSIASDMVLPSAREYLVDLVEGYRARPAITVTPSMFGPRSGAMAPRSWPLSARRENSAFSYRRFETAPLTPSPSPTGPSRPASTASSPTTTSGPWAHRRGRPWRPLRSSRRGATP